MLAKCTFLHPAKSLPKPLSATQGEVWRERALSFHGTGRMLERYASYSLYLIAVAVHRGYCGHRLQVGRSKRRHALQRSTESRRGKIEGGIGAVVSIEREPVQWRAERCHSAEPNLGPGLQLVRHHFAVERRSVHECNVGSRLTPFAADSAIRSSSLRSFGRQEARGHFFLGHHVQSLPGVSRLAHPQFDRRRFERRRGVLCTGRHISCSPAFHTSAEFAESSSVLRAHSHPSSAPSFAEVRYVC